MALQRPSFTTSRFVETYDMAEVDDAVDRIFAALAEPVRALSAGDVQAMRFTPTRLREGYAMDEVDTWLDEAVAELDRRGGGSVEAAPAATAYAPARSEAVVEVPGPPRRWPLFLPAALVVAFVVYYAFFA